MTTEETIPIESRLEGRRIRLAAVGDIHFDDGGRAPLAELFGEATRNADILVLCGDLTTHGRPEQVRGIAEELARVEIPVVAVLGNHDYEDGSVEEVSAILRDHGVHLLDGDYTVIEGIGFAGVKGFAGGFGRGALAPFGEPLIKEFVQASLDDALRLENALRTLPTDIKVVVLHYAPIIETVLGEPEVIFPFLGSSRLLQPIETLGASVVFHGHVHHGAPEGRTPSGIPVYNVSWPLLRANGENYRLWTVEAPERRRFR